MKWMSVSPFKIFDSLIMIINRKHDELSIFSLLLNSNTLTWYKNKIGNHIIMNYILYFFKNKFYLIKRNFSSCKFYPVINLIPYYPSKSLKFSLRKWVKRKTNIVLNNIRSYLALLPTEVITALSGKHYFFLS
jgi:hypothetical protein